MDFSLSKTEELFLQMIREFAEKSAMRRPFMSINRLNMNKLKKSPAPPCILSRYMLKWKQRVYRLMPVY